MDQKYAMNNRNLFPLNNLKLLQYHSQSVTNNIVKHEELDEGSNIFQDNTSSIEYDMRCFKSGSLNIQHIPSIAETNFGNRFAPKDGEDSFTTNTDRSFEKGSTFDIKTEDNHDDQKNDQDEGLSPLTDSPASLKQEDFIVPKVEQDPQKTRKPRKHYHQKPRNYWLHTEDLLLLKLIEEHGKKWTKIATLMDGRNGKQVRDRYMNYLRPNIKQREWTDEEDYLLIKLYGEFGNRWSRIALYLQGRTENQVKNRFHAAMRKEKRRIEKRKKLYKYDPNLNKLLKINGGVEKISIKNGLVLNFHQVHSLKPMIARGDPFDFLAQSPHLSLPFKPASQHNITQQSTNFDNIPSQVECKLESSYESYFSPDKPLDSFPPRIYSGGNMDMDCAKDLGLKGDHFMEAPLKIPSNLVPFNQNVKRYYTNFPLITHENLVVKYESL